MMKERPVVLSVDEVVEMIEASDTFELGEATRGPNMTIMEKQWTSKSWAKKYPINELRNYVRNDVHVTSELEDDAANEALTNLLGKPAYRRGGGRADDILFRYDRHLPEAKVIEETYVHLKKRGL